MANPRDSSSWSAGVGFPADFIDVVGTFFGSPTIGGQAQCDESARAVNGRLDQFYSLRSQRCRSRNIGWTPCRISRRKLTWCLRSDRKSTEEGAVLSTPLPADGELRAEQRIGSRPYNS
jgi:hypothetical protein